MNRLLIVDGHAYAYRAFHAIRNLRGPDGQPTNAIYGFVKMFDKMRGALQPALVAVVWDGGLSVERTTVLPEYKTQRPEMPADLCPQLDEIREYLMAAGIASFCHPGVEADDFIGSLAQRAANRDWQVVIASSDKDFMQLVSPQIGLWNPQSRDAVVWSRDEVVAKTGVEPEKIVDWLALMGDAVDNIPGVTGVGPKTAAELVNQFGSVAGLYERLPDVKSEKLRAALVASADAVKRNVKLVRLLDIACEFAPEQLAVKPANQDRLYELFGRWGFKGMTESLGRAQSGQQVELI